MTIAPNVTLNELRYLREKPSQLRALASFAFALALAGCSDNGNVLGSQDSGGTGSGGSDQGGGGARAASGGSGQAGSGNHATSGGSNQAGSGSGGHAGSGGSNQAGSGGSAEAGTGGNSSVPCVGSNCTPGQACIAYRTEGGAVFYPDDAGACESGKHAESGRCVADFQYACAKLVDCGAANNACRCAPTTACSNYSTCAAASPNAWIDPDASLVCRQLVP